MATIVSKLTDQHWCSIRDFLAPEDLYQLYESSPQFAQLVTVESIINSLAARKKYTRWSPFWPGDDNDMSIFLGSVRAGTVLPPSTKRLLRIVNHAESAQQAIGVEISCDFCAAQKATYLSATRGLLLCSPRCPLRKHRPDEANRAGLSWPLTDLTSNVEELLNSDERTAAWVKWWRNRGFVYTTMEPAFDSATGERVGCSITKNQLDSMTARPWTPEKLASILPDVDALPMERLFAALEHAREFQWKKN